MNNLERIYMITFFTLTVVFVVIYQIWFWPHLKGTPEILHIPQDSMRLIIYTAMFLSLVAQILLFRDLYLRKMEDKSGWLIALIMFSVVAAPLYYCKHARYPRSVLA